MWRRQSFERKEATSFKMRKKLSMFSFMRSWEICSSLDSKIRANKLLQEFLLLVNNPRNLFQKVWKLAWRRSHVKGIFSASTHVASAAFSSWHPQTSFTKFVANPYELFVHVLIKKVFFSSHVLNTRLPWCVPSPPSPHAWLSRTSSSRDGNLI